MALPTDLNELYGKADAATLSERHDKFLAALGATPDTLKGDVQFVPGGSATGPSLIKVESPAETLEKMVADGTLNKALGADLLATVQTALAERKTQMPDLQKDLTLTNPLSTGYVAYDLEAPAKMLTPRPTPLRNRLRRTKGVGTSRKYKRITGFTGTGTGGVGVMRAGITDATQTNFANAGSANNLWYNRGPKIQYAGDEATVPYLPFSVSDEVTWTAQYSGMGFQDIRALSKASLMYASMLIEERQLLMARGTAAGFSGALAAPAQPTGVARAKSGSEVGISGATTSLYVKVTADAGDFGQSVLSVVSAAIAVTNGQVVDVTIPDVPGAVGYRVYVSTGAADPGDGARWYAGRTGYNTFTIQGALPTSGTAASSITGDSSASAGDYDGILPIVLGPNSGKVNRINAGFDTAIPGREFQVVFESLYDAVKADPDRIMFHGADRRQFSDAIRTGGTNSDYRLMIAQNDVHGIVSGAVVTTLVNGITGKDVALEVHPWLPQGNCPVISDTLPIPDTEVSDCWNVVNVQDLMGVDWPIMQFSYDCSSFWYGTFLCYAPAWQGAVAGVKYVPAS